MATDIEVTERATTSTDAEITAAIRNATEFASLVHVSGCGCTALVQGVVTEGAAFECTECYMTSTAGSVLVIPVVDVVITD